MDNMSNWKEQMKERTLYGCFVTFASPDIAEMTAMMGFDFLLLDNEHGVIEQSTLVDMVRASQLRGVPAVIRCTMKEYDHIQKALDFGANGIQLPLMNTAEDAKRIVDMANYFPEGHRGTAYLPRASQYGMVQDKRAYLKMANERKLLSCQVETKQAVENLDALLAVDGIDVYFVGPGDLAASYNEPTCSPHMLEITEDVIRRIVAAGKIAGYYVGTPEQAKQAESWGARYLVTAVNQYMVAGGKNFLSQVRGEAAVGVQSAY
jgi:2-keto-3-deoxy-L-rhamnonate aldolase RhmA